LGHLSFHAEFIMEIGMDNKVGIHSLGNHRFKNADVRSKE
jgi:hypothetical protein